MMNCRRRLVVFVGILAVATIFLTDTLLSSDRHKIVLPKRIIRLDKLPSLKDGAASDLRNVGERSNSTACQLAQLQLNDPSISHYLHSPEPLQCSTETNWVYVGREGSFEIDPAAVGRHGHISCDYEPFWRVNDTQIKSETHRDYPNGAPLLSDFFTARCRAADGEDFSNIYAAAVISQKALRRAKATKRPADWSGLNVYQLGFDSVSRMMFERKMKRTYKFLTEDLEAVVLNGYNIVGDGTPQAFIPILTGKTEEELPLTRHRFPQADFVNVYPMIWKDFEKNGYVTLYGEDSAAIGTFTYRLKGFDKQPTDHYIRTFYLEAERAGSAIKFACFGSETQLKTFLRYSEDFFNAYPADVPKFAVHFHSQLSHDDFNMIELADEETLTHLEALQSAGHLNNSLLIVMSDHGHRYSEMRGTQQGQLEERLPFYSLVAPRWWRAGPGKLAWANLRLNADRLTSPFDIYATLQRMIHWRQPGVGRRSQRSIALWDVVPRDRTCAEAGIADHWCSCLRWRPVPTMLHPLAEALARSIVTVINSETERERKLCAKLQLAKMESVLMLAPPEDVLKYKQSKDYDGFEPDLTGDTQLVAASFQLRFWTSPGEALYEATVPYDMRVAEVGVDLRVVSHIKKYGDKPHCVIDKDYFLAKWCVCYDKITSSD